MRVSLINLNWVAHDAIGQCLSNQVRFFRRRGDEVQVYLLHPPHDVPDDLASLAHVVGLADLIARGDRHFAQSDLYVFHYPGRYPLLESIKEIDRGVVIFYYHNVTPPEYWGSDFDQESLQRSLESVGLFTHYADLVVTDSQFNADQLVDQYGCESDRIRVLPLAVALDQFSPGPQDLTLRRQYNLEGRRAILFVGRMAGNKRVDLLVEALPLVQRQVPNAVLLLVGDDKGNPAIQETVAGARARAAELGVARDVIFTGTVRSLPPYYRLADAYATASLHEGFGVPLIEAMASGLPIVASQTTAHPWVLAEAGLLVEPGNVEDLADKIVRVLTDDDLCGQLVQRGLARAREFSLEHYEAGWARIIAEATAWLPDQPYPRPRALSAEAGGLGAKSRMERLSVTVREALLSDELRQLEANADVMLRDYAVRSRLPVVGPLIAWFRRNLTSHLREPYLDPTFERQVTFNWQILGWLKQVQSFWLAVSAEERAQVDERLAELGAEIKQLREQLAQLSENRREPENQ